MCIAFSCVPDSRCIYIICTYSLTCTIDTYTPTHIFVRARNNQQAGKFACRAAYPVRLGVLLRVPAEFQDGHEDGQRQAAEQHHEDTACNTWTAWKTRYYGRERKKRGYKGGNENRRFLFIFLFTFPLYRIVGICFGLIERLVFAAKRLEVTGLLRWKT